MVTFEELRKVEPALAKVSDEELENIRNLLYAHAQLALECFLEDKGGSKNIALGSEPSGEDMKKLQPCKMENQKME